MTYSTPILKKILDHVLDRHKKRQPSMVVFDIDSTLFDVSPRNQAILRSFSQDENYQRLFPAQCKSLERAVTSSTDWGIKSCIQKAGIELTPDFSSVLLHYWSKHFFSNKFLHHDRPYYGAADYVNDVFRRGAQVLYLTGRPRAQMYDGTFSHLKSCGFPVEESTLLMKPDHTLDDAGYKVDKFKGLCQAQHAIYFFENEPVIIDAVRSYCPSVNIVFMKSVHSGRLPDPEDLPVLSKSFF